MGNVDIDIVKVIKTHRPHIENTVRKTVKNPSLVDDIVQDVCIKIYNYFQNYGSSPKVGGDKLAPCF